MIDKDLKELIELLSDHDFTNEEKLRAIKYKIIQYNGVSSKKNKIGLPIFNDISQMIDIAIEIPNELVRKSCLKLIIELLIEFNNYYLDGFDDSFKIIQGRNKEAIKQN